MDKAKNIFDWIWMLTKIIFSIILVVVGIKLLLFIVLPINPFSVYYSPFIEFDWNPLTTIIGAFITGGITWYAVYKTAEFDKKARIYEFKYSHYIETLNVLNEALKTIDRLTYYFEKDEDCIINKTMNDEFLNCENNIRKFKKTYTYLCNINSNFAKKMHGFDLILENFIKIYSFTVRQINEHRWFLSNGDPKYKKEFIKNLNEKKIIYCVDDLLTYYKDNTNIEYDINEMTDSISKLRKIIEEEFKMDEK